MNNNSVNIIPSQPPVNNKSDVRVVKSRLQWGEPGFTIIDVRSRQTYNNGHIMGALSMKMDNLADTAIKSLSKSRDIYVYGADDAETKQALQTLICAGFENVSELNGGFPAGQAIGGSTEGIVESIAN